MLTLAECADVPGQGVERDNMIAFYFHAGYSYHEILCSLLLLHNINISLRHLKRLLNRMNLKRRAINGHVSPLDSIIEAILTEIQDSGSCIGYRTMWRRLQREHGLIVKKDTVLEIMRIIDPQGIQLRKAHRLRRRRYINPGPNHVWHIDGYDKIKPYGFAIHGAIDGFSRRIMWLEVGKSNNNPAQIATYYLNTVGQLGYVPKILRGDMGTENSLVSLLQPYFRRDGGDRFAGLNSFVYGKSTSNQRIEAWWCLLRKMGLDWWISMFKDLRDSGRYNECKSLHVQCLKFCFMDIIQAELDRIRDQWNIHPMRATRHGELPTGKPDVLHFTPEMYGTEDKSHPVDAADVDACLEMYGTTGPKMPCMPEFIELVHMIKPDIQFPKTVTEGLKLYFELTASFQEYDDA